MRTVLLQKHEGLQVRPLLCPRFINCCVCLVSACTSYMCPRITAVHLYISCNPSRVPTCLMTVACHLYVGQSIKKHELIQMVPSRLRATEAQYRGSHAFILFPPSTTDFVHSSRGHEPESLSENAWALNTSLGCVLPSSSIGTPFWKKILVVLLGALRRLK